MSDSATATLDLIRRALDDIDVVPLSASLRRAQRIATQLGEVRDAVRFAMELVGGAGGHEASAVDLNRLSDRGDLTAQEEALALFVSDRTITGSDNVQAIPVDALEMFLAKAPPDPGRTSRQGYADYASTQYRLVELAATIKARVYAALCSWERQLTFRARNEHLLTGHQQRLDALLRDEAPNVLDRFNAVYARFGSANVSGGIEAAEELSQAVTSCRRILKAVVDHVMPAMPDMETSAEGHVLNESAYRNRLREYFKMATASGSFTEGLAAAAGALLGRFEAADKLGSKGVHADLAGREAEFCALNTWLIAGEILALHQQVAE